MIESNQSGPGGSDRALRFHPGRGPAARLCRGDARGPRPRRRPLRAGEPGRGSTPQTIAGFAGRPYAEVAVEVIRPFVGDAIARARSRPHGARGLRHLPPSRGRAADAVRRERFRARAVPRPDARLQGPGDAAPGAADGPCAGRARRAHHHRGRDLGRYRRRRGRGVPRPRPRRSLRAVPARPHLRRAAAHDDHGRGRQRPCARDRRHLRRLPGDREGHVQPPRLPRPGAALRRQFDQLGAHRRAGRSITSPPRSRSARRTARSPSRCRPGISATSMPAMSRCAWACRSTGW